MKPPEEDLYRLYLLGCGTLDWTPLDADEFRALYAIYSQCHDPFFVPAIGRRWQPVRLLFAPFRWKRIRHNLRTRKQLRFLETAVRAGRKRIDEGGQAANGVPARPLPIPPIRREGAARSLSPEELPGVA